MRTFKKIIVALTVAATVVSSPLSAYAYQNGINVDGQWSASKVEYGIGDPFVMKYNGMYYLYCSTYDPVIGVKVWSSEDMGSWNYEGFCTDTTDAVMKGAYAPEVTYWNGTFYMYTAAPGGDQHRVLTSKSPLGPFERQNDVFTDPDDLIDGSVFIDDDEAATKYFLHSGFNSIEYGLLNDNMLTAEGRYLISEANVINHWTEGPSIFKRNDKYYMTYCGNHVLADNYMIEYVAGDSVVGMKQPEENLLLINTEEGITGLGHNSSVVGPDLDSRYIVYHNLDSNASAADRRLNIDRMVFNGEKLEVQGPTWWEMDNPRLPEFYDRMENADNWDTVAGTAVVEENWMLLDGTEDFAEMRSKEATPDNYTAEFNLAIAAYEEVELESSGTAAPKFARAGAVVSYVDENNYGFVYIQPQTNTLHFDVRVAGETVTSSANLPEEYVYGTDVLNKLTVKKEGNVIDIYADDRHLITTEAELAGGKIGLKTDGAAANYSYTAFSSAVNGNQDKDTVKPTGSAMDAVHANSTSRDFETGSIIESGAGLESYYVKEVTTGDSLTFKINPQETSYYSAEILAKAEEGTMVSLSIDGEEVAKEIAMTPSDSFFTDVVRNIAITEDVKEITLTVTAGIMDLYSLRLDKAEDIFTASETQETMNFEWLNGSWTEDEDTISTTDASVWSTASYGSENWDDYEYEADVCLNSGSDAGLMVRLNYATDASDAKKGIGGCESADYHYGYYAFISTNGVHLGKQMFNWKTLDSHMMQLSRGQSYHLKVRAEGANIKVWLDEELVIDYTDTKQPILSGKVGLRAMTALGSYQNITLTHLNAADPIGEPIVLAEGVTPINKNTFQMFSNADGKGYELVDGGIYFSNAAGRNAKGYLKEEAALDSTVSCDIQLPGTGGFNVGLLVRCKPAAFGSDTNAMDGVGVHVTRGADGSLDVNAYVCVNGSQGTWEKANIPNYFVDKQPRTAHLTVVTEGNELTAYVDNKECLTMDLTNWSNETRTAVGFRAYQTARVTLTNFTYMDSVQRPEPIPDPIIELPYEDVVENDWFYNAVAYTYVEGLMTGMDATHFGPYGQLSRAQFALILYRMLPEHTASDVQSTENQGMEDTPVVDTDKTFGDIVGDEWYGPAVLWAAENGIVTGYQNGNFGPADMITREQMAVMMYRYAEYLGQDVTADGTFDAFADAESVSGFAAEAMQWAVGGGIITGKENGTKLDPQGNTARAEAAVIIQRFMH